MSQNLYIFIDNAICVKVEKVIIESFKMTFLLWSHDLRFKRMCPCGHSTSGSSECGHVATRLQVLATGSTSPLDIRFKRTCSPDAWTSTQLTQFLRIFQLYSVLNHLFTALQKLLQFVAPMDCSQCSVTISWSHYLLHCYS